MGTMYERIAALCSQKGIKPGKLCADTGLSRGLLSDLKNGRTKSLSAKNARVIAEYFDVRVGWLMGEEDAPRPVTDADITFPTASPEEISPFLSKSMSALPPRS